jgi:hypothetical protein
MSQQCIHDLRRPTRIAFAQQRREHASY